MRYTQCGVFGRTVALSVMVVALFQWTPLGPHVRHSAMSCNTIRIASQLPLTPECGPVYKGDQIDYEDEWFALLADCWKRDHPGSALRVHHDWGPPYFWIEWVGPDNSAPPLEIDDYLMNAMDAFLYEMYGAPPLDVDEFGANLNIFSIFIKNVNKYG